MKTIIFAAAFCLASFGAMAQDSHAGHNHAPGAHDAHGHGNYQALGAGTLAGHKIVVAQSGKLEKEGVFQIALEKGTAKPKAIRAWVGDQTAEGSVKSRAEGEGPTYDMHLTLPKVMPKGAQLWVEIEPVKGKTAKGAFTLK